MDSLLGHPRLKRTYTGYWVPAPSWRSPLVAPAGCIWEGTAYVKRTKYLEGSLYSGALCISCKLLRLLCDKGGLCANVIFLEKEKKWRKEGRNGMDFCTIKTQDFWSHNSSLYQESYKSYKLVWFVTLCVNRIILIKSKRYKLMMMCLLGQCSFNFNHFNGTHAGWGILGPCLLNVLRLRNSDYRQAFLPKSIDFTCWGKLK